jgi:hypothetical protein
VDITRSRFAFYETTNERHCVSIGLEDKPSSLIGLVDRLIPTWEEIPFAGALLWIRERGIWGDHSEKIGATLIQQMRLSAGTTATLEECPGHLFGPQEIYEAHSSVLLPILFGWDAFLFLPERDYFIFISHDGVAGVVTRNRETYEEVYRRVQDWNPREDTEWYFKHV